MRARHRHRVLREPRSPTSFERRRGGDARPRASPRRSAAAKLERRDVGFTVSGSCDYLGGRPFSFVITLDAVGAWPPIGESHVEMDGALALYEAWVACSTATSTSRSSTPSAARRWAISREVLGAQLDPYYVAPLGVDATSLAALQARALLDAGRAPSATWPRWPPAPQRGAQRVDASVDALLAAPYLVAPLRAHDCRPPPTPSPRVVLAAGDRARGLLRRARRGSAASTTASSRTRSARAISRARPPPRSPPRRPACASARSTSPSSTRPSPTRRSSSATPSAWATDVDVNPSGGALAARPVSSSPGLTAHRRGGAAASTTGERARAVAHATSGPCLQQNLVCVLEGD